MALSLEKNRILLKRNTIRQDSRLVSAIIYVFIGIVSVVTLYPFIFIASNSISNPVESAANAVWFLPKGPLSIKSYQQIFTSNTIGRAFLNSVFFTVVITYFNVFNSMLAGYALSVRNLFGRKVFVMMILITMFFNAGLIPTFIIIVNLGMFNTLFAIILPSIISVWNIILARTYINNMPSELKEAAYIDGASVYQTVTRVIIPLAKPIIAVLALYTALAVWNAWFNYLVYLPSRPEWHPLQLFLTKSLIWGNLNAVLNPQAEMDPELIKNKLLMAAVNAQLKYAVVMVASIPVIMIYPFVQKYFIQGALLGSLKE